MAGAVSPPTATVLIEGVEVAVDPRTGLFQTEVPLASDLYLNVDIRARVGELETRLAVPVFAGDDPLDRDPGGVSFRLTPEALSPILSLSFDAGLLNAALSELSLSLPTVREDWIELLPQGLTLPRLGFGVGLGDSGIDVTITLDDLIVEYLLRLRVDDEWLEGPLDLVYRQSTLVATAAPALDDKEALSLVVGPPVFELDDAIVRIAGFDSALLSEVADVLGDILLEPIGEVLGSILLSGFSNIPLGGPFDFETDLFGTPLRARLAEIYGDSEGFAGTLAIGIDEEPTKPVTVPVPPAAFDLAPVDLAIGLDESLLHRMILGSGFVDTYTQDLRFDGVVGEKLFGQGAREILGGSGLPDEVDGYCVKVDPAGGNPTPEGAPAIVSRLQDGISPLGVILIPDLRVEIATVQDDECVPWLQATLSAEVELNVTTGTVLEFDLQYGDGAVLSYATSAQWVEDRVLGDVEDYLDDLIGLLGEAPSFDLADLVAGLDPADSPLGALELEIVGSEPMRDASGAQVEGVYSVLAVLAD